MSDFSEQVTKPAALQFAGRAADTEFRLHVISGPEQGTTFTLDGDRPPRVYLGQSTGCELRLTDPRVSRRHAALDLAGAHVILTDLDSRNGTYVNGVSVLKARLVGDELIKVGDTALKVERVATASTPTTSADRFGAVVGASVEMRRLYAVLERLARSTEPILIEGEAGTGKDLVAETLHAASARAGGPFHVVDVANTPDVETSVFGPHGVYSDLAGGTLVLDELGALGFAGQAALAATLKRAPYAGAPWIVATSRTDLEGEVMAGRFREDVLQPFDAGRLELPPLRRRDGDVRYLAHHLWGRLGGVPERFPFDLLESLTSYAWPGNVAELETALTQRLVGRVGARPSSSSAGPHSAGGGASEDFIDATLSLDLQLVPSRERVIQEFERRYLERALTRQNGNVLRAAAASGVARRYFQILRARRFR
jgi:two-component system, NtrC family, response regulator HydG